MNPRDVSGEGASSILRAVGSLLVALSGGDQTDAQAQAQRTLSEMQASSEPTAETPSATRPSRQVEAQPPSPRASVPPPRAYPQPQGRSAPPEARPDAPRAGAPRTEGVPSDLLDEVEFVLADARDRAQAIIDESTEQARELIRQERVAHPAPVTGIDPSAFDDLRRGLRGLVTEVRDIQQRLARIEQLIRDQNARTASHATSEGGEAPAFSTSIVAPAPEPSDGYGEATQYPEPRAVEAEPLPAWQAPEPAYHEPAYYEPTYHEPAVDESEYGEPLTEAPRYVDEDDAGFEQSEAYAEPEFESSTPSTEPEQEAPDPFKAPEAPGTPYAPASAPPRAPFSVVPPQRREWDSSAVRETELDEDLPTQPESPRPPESEGIAPEAPAAYQAPPSPPRAFGRAEPAAELTPDPVTWEDEAYNEPDETSERYEPAASSAIPSDSPLVTFLPSDGAITLRVAPVAGFQGLMRIQDALTRLPVVRHASVEAYSQGEARLRLELADASDSDEIAEGLARALRGPARVEDASEVNRELLIGLR